MDQRLRDRIKRDAFHDALAMSEHLDGVGIRGYGLILLSNPDEFIVEPFTNLITTAGDEYYAKKAIAAIAPASPSAPTAMTGMKLGTGTTAVAKSGAGAALVTYLTASNQAFDASYPVAAVVAGTDLGWTVAYSVTWATGVATNSAITEAVIVDDSASNATSVAGDTLARIVFTARDKAANDTMQIVWRHKFIGV